MGSLISHGWKISVRVVPTFIGSFLNLRIKHVTLTIKINYTIDKVIYVEKAWRWAWREEATEGWLGTKGKGRMVVISRFALLSRWELLETGNISEFVHRIIFYRSVCRVDRIWGFPSYFPLLRADFPEILLINSLPYISRL